MASKSRTVTAKALQGLLSHIGSVGTGTKDVLHARFARDVRRPRLFDLRPEWKQRLSHQDPRSQKLRILSIDMGVKNLAYCHAELSYRSGDRMKPKMDIERWEKISIVDTTQNPHQSLPREKEELGVLPEDEVDPYSLDVLSATAYRFLSKTALKLAPDIILIEKQRWRSGSSATILQWTVRVNTLEAMLWAILETLKTEYLLHSTRAKQGYVASNYEICSVDPRYLGPYWLGQHAKALAERIDDGRMAPPAEEEFKDRGAEKTSRSKAEKKAKIALLSSWLSEHDASTADSTPKSGSTISFTFSKDAENTRRALYSHDQKRKKKTRQDRDAGKLRGEDELRETVLSKLDDVTDCFLQAAAWVAWETNRLQLWDVLDRRRGPSGEIPPLDEEILREMVEVAEKGQARDANMRDSR